MIKKGGGAAFPLYLLRPPCARRQRRGKGPPPCQRQGTLRKAPAQRALRGGKGSKERGGERGLLLNLI